MFNSDRYKRGAHTVLELQYHFVWKTKYGYPILRGDIGLRVRELNTKNPLEVKREQPF